MRPTCSVSRSSIGAGLPRAQLAQHASGETARSTRPSATTRSAPARIDEDLRARLVETGEHLVERIDAWSPPPVARPSVPRACRAGPSAASRAASTCGQSTSTTSPRAGIAAFEQQRPTSAALPAPAIRRRPHPRGFASRTCARPAKIETESGRRPCGPIKSLAGCLTWSKIIRGIGLRSAFLICANRMRTKQDQVKYKCVVMDGSRSACRRAPALHVARRFRRWTARCSRRSSRPASARAGGNSAGRG